MPQIVSGAIELIKTATNWLYAIIPGTTVIIFVYHAWLKSMADGDVGEIASRNKAMRRTVQWGAVALGGNGIVNLIMSYLAP